LDTNVITHWVNKAHGHELIEEHLFTLTLAGFHRRVKPLESET
jgi:hypothetical protein